MDALTSLGGLLQDLSSRLASVEAHLGISPAASGATGGAGGPAAAKKAEVPLAPSVVAWDALCTQSLTPFLTAANAIGDKAADLGKLVEKAAAANRSVILTASRCKKPTDRKVIEGVLAPVTEQIKAVNALKDRSSPFVNHMNAIAEGMNAFQWVGIEPMPVPVVESCVEAAEFWSNKVRVQYRGKDDNQMAFCNTFKLLLQAIQAYVKEYHVTGVTWNPRGTDVASYQAEAASVPSAAPAAAPAPPATVAPPAVAAPAPAPAPAPAAGLTDLFAELSKIDQSSGRTAGLKHVTKDMKSKGSSAPVSVAPPVAGAGGSAPKPVAAAPAKPPRLECIKKRWYVENHVTAEPITIADAAVDNEVYISGCVGATIIITNKIKTMTIDSCKRTKIVFQAAISACEMVNCQRLQVQVKGVVPAVAIDKTDGCQVFLSYASRDTKIVTSKSSELNVSFPVSEAEDADWTELPIPEQFVSSLVDGKLRTTVSDLYSS